MSTDKPRKRNGLEYQSKVVELLRNGEQVDRFVLAEAIYDYEVYKTDSKYAEGINADIDSKVFRTLLRNNFEVSEKRNLAGAIKTVKYNISVRLGVTLCQGRSKTRSNVPCYWWPEDADISLLDNYEQDTKKERTLRMQNAIELMRSSYGIMPSSWLAKLVEEDLYSEDNEKIIEFEQAELYGAEKLPDLYFAIRDKHVVCFQYQPWGQPKQSVALHPHYLKEYNFRWYVFGLGIVDGKEEKKFHWSLDRIVGKIKENKSIRYKESTRDYSTYFDDIIGVTHINKAATENIIIITKDRKIHNRLLTKPIHDSQEEVEEYNEETGYGKFTLTIRYNPELISRLLSFGARIAVEGELGSMVVEKLREEYSNIKKNLEEKSENEER